MLDNTNYNEDNESMNTNDNLEEQFKITSKAFEDNGYIVLTEVLSKEQCQQLTEHLFELERNGKLEQDQQCPVSGAIYGDPVFDNLMVQLAEGLGNQVGKRLLPTYTYARLYKPGEVLKRHKDRPSCEISATLTLGHDETTPVWPIFFDERKEISVDLEPGTLAMYKGCEVEHWRTAFKGKWQAQVFLHYVDADGPYKDHAMDGRQGYGTSKHQVDQVTDATNYNQNLVYQSYNSNTGAVSGGTVAANIPPATFGAILLPKDMSSLKFGGYVGFNHQNFPDLAFNKEECEKIISFADHRYPNPAKVGGGGPGNTKREIRSADIYDITPEPETAWIHQKVSNAVYFANKNHFDYDVNTISHALQLIHYRADEKIPGHYDWHIDAGPGDSITRKISFTVQLSDPNNYTGCDLLVNDHGKEVKAIRDQGSLSMFPSYMPHCVTPIESGERWALVIWVHGPKPFR